MFYSISFCWFHSLFALFLSFFRQAKSDIFIVTLYSCLSYTILFNATNSCDENNNQGSRKQNSMWFFSAFLQERIWHLTKDSDTFLEKENGIKWREIEALAVSMSCPFFTLINWLILTPSQSLYLVGERRTMPIFWMDHTITTSRANPIENWQCVSQTVYYELWSVPRNKEGVWVANLWDSY